MEIKLSNAGYNIISSGSVILYEAHSELKFSIKASEDFSFEIVLQFINDDKQERSLDKEVRDNTSYFKCANFENTIGIGTVNPLPIATVAGKEWLLHFWSYTMGDNKVRKVSYTFFEKE